MRPDGGYAMDLAHADERVLASALVHLAVVEPGTLCWCLGLWGRPQRL